MHMHIHLVWEAGGKPQAFVGITVDFFGDCNNEDCQGQMIWDDGTEVMGILQGSFDMKFKVNCPSSFFIYFVANQLLL